MSALASLVTVVALAIPAADAAAPPVPPPWADSAMPVTKGLQLWLDAGKLQAARAAHGRPALLDGTACDAWYDGSGFGRHVVQNHQAAQPRLASAGEFAALRFDGKEDCLELTGLRKAFENLTLLIVAAPRSNAGFYRALLSAHEIGKNDYTTGFNVDLSGAGSAQVDRINIEGAGFGGEKNLLKSPLRFGEFHTYEFRCRPGPGGVGMAVDGAAALSRDRGPGKVTLDTLVVGSRIYSNSAEPPFLQGFFDGDIAAILIYDRVLDDAESVKLHEYLRSRFAGLDRALATAGNRRGVPLESVTSPPAVQMFVPGFTVRELPVELKNVNNVRYRSDGKLVAMCYDGNIYLLSDSDGDGLEDRADLFWENTGQIQSPIGMALTPPGYSHGTGVFVACKGKVALVVDAQGTGRADREIVVAQGWKQLPHNVDALGVAVDSKGHVYFGLGTTDYTNAYQVGADGKAVYDLRNERGTVVKVAPDFSSREIVATGIRFPVGMAFNHRGDLFVTDQEGATWLPNGNPFDELLHVQPGRHYGFPPRHPRHLSGVIDEPSVFDYGPQHQSTCGLQFDEPVNGGPVFGPAWWQHDALVAGYARGKLYRTKLVSTPTGYVAHNQLLACLNMLTADTCVSPRGDLVVAVHSGSPDWGSGPNGKGKLYKIEYRDHTAPQPVLAWAAGPREVRVAFDRPVDLADLKDLARKLTIEYGAAVSAGDRFESLRPGYAAVAAQLAASRLRLAVHSAFVTPDRRSLILNTDPAADATRYAVTLPGIGRPSKSANGTLPQVPEIDLGFDLTGVTASWESADGKSTTTAWLPHVDLDVARNFTVASADHDRFWKETSAPGRLTLKGQLNLKDLLRPAVQPGSQIDYKWPPEQATIVLRSSGPLEVKSTVGQLEEVAKAGAPVEWRWQIPAGRAEPVPFEIALATGPQPVLLRVTWLTQEDPRERAFPLSRILVSWGTTSSESTDILVRAEIPELKGGHWQRGRAIFFGEQAICSRCHTVGGQGGHVGPDLSNLIHRDYASVLRDIRTPSAAINPDHVAFALELKSGRVLAGLVRREGNNVIVGDSSGQEHSVPADDVESISPMSVSIMPEGIDKILNAEKLRDLMTFLLTEPLSPAPIERPGAPPPRSRSDVETVLKGTQPKPPTDRRLHIVLCSGPKDHGPGEHDYPLWQRRWVKLFDLADNVFISEADGWPSKEQLADAHLIVFYSNNPGWSAARADELDGFLSRGGGLVYVHYAVDGHNAVGELARNIGLAWQGGRSKFRHGPLDLAFPNPQHPITRGFDKVKVHFEDESYWNLSGDPQRIEVLASGIEEGAAQPLFWAREAGKGRVFVSILGHYTWTFDDPLFRVLMLRGMAWSMGESVDRFNPLIYPGAVVAP